jgi:hypothetical protein
MTEKRFPSVQGDGRRSLDELILDDPRAVCLASAYRRASKRDLGSIPSPGERVQLVEIGSHCRGAIFVDGLRLVTPQLERAVDAVAKRHSGFYFGRFDVRAGSYDAIQRGHFTVLELNGVTGEPAHIYDPTVSIWTTYRTLFAHWRMAFEIGTANRDAGFSPMSLRELTAVICLRMVCSRQGRPPLEAPAGFVMMSRP